MENINRLQTLKKAQELLKPIMENDLSRKQYMIHLRCSYGYLLDAIRRLEKGQEPTNKVVGL